MNAEIVTNYPDTRPEGEIDEPLDEEFWDNLNKNVDSTETQGIIKLKRAMDDGTTQTMTYVTPETFNMYIENYNISGSEADKQTALKHFTIEKNITTWNLENNDTMKMTISLNDAKNTILNVSINLEEEENEYTITKEEKIVDKKKILPIIIILVILLIALIVIFVTIAGNNKDNDNTNNLVENVQTAEETNNFFKQIDDYQTYYTIKKYNEQLYYICKTYNWR